MKDILYSEYHGTGTEKIEVDDCYIIVQTLSEPGHVYIGDETYGMTNGDLYFFSGGQTYHFQPKEREGYIQNQIALSKEFVDQLAQALDFTDIIHDIFSRDGGLYVPLRNFKTVNDRFKSICAQSKSDKAYSKALMGAHLIALLNYAVHGMGK